MQQNLLQFEMFFVEQNIILTHDIIEYLIPGIL